MIELARVKQIFEGIRAEIGKVIIGQDETVNLMLAALLVKGHILLEGVPGTAKTLTVKTAAEIIGASFRRIQMTPDLMPSDVLGTNIFDARSGAFHVHKGPIFSDLVLVDEINRAPAKTQSALLECMEERQVTIEGNCFELSAIFTVMATQNSLEYEGTYPLPEAQLDRFLFKILLDYPSEQAERGILGKFEAGFRSDNIKKVGLSKVADIEEIKECREAITRVQTREPVIDYITDIVRATRDWSDFHIGAGVRASIGLLLASKAAALMEGREFVTPDDVKAMVCPVLRHRVILKPEAEIEGINADSALTTMLGRIKVPR
ncbi:MAG TPA: magnesium chelatase [Candidatus Riflebacteria bacterium]|jgi:MoxR-like ATPase|nr:magnesium chelatase [Candidatus Riflebacteria bacterium]